MKFVYHGPMSGATIRLDDGEERDVMFHDGAPVDLPESHPYTKSLVAQGYLKPAPIIDEKRVIRGDK